MPTILDSIKHEAEGLQVYCGNCRVTHMIPWSKLPTLRLGEKVEALRYRMKCTRCFQRPESVEAVKQTTGYLPSFKQ